MKRFSDYYVGLTDVVGGVMWKVMSPETETRWFNTTVECRAYIKETFHGYIREVLLSDLRCRARASTRKPYIINT